MRSLASLTLTEYANFYAVQIEGLLEAHFRGDKALEWKIAEKTPCSVSPQVFKVAEIITQVCDEMRISLLFNVNLTARQRSGGGIPLARKEWHHLVFPSSKKRQSMEYEMERYLAKKLRVRDAVEFSATSVTNALAKTALKSMYELARESYLTNAGFNQVQVDTLLLFSVVRSLVTQDDHG